MFYSGCLSELNVWILFFLNFFFFLLNRGVQKTFKIVVLRTSILETLTELCKYEWWFVVTARLFVVSFLF